jgi:CubicO group peptidase (beta-lactamase class C family)
MKSRKPIRRVPLLLILPLLVSFLVPAAAPAAAQTVDPLQGFAEQVESARKDWGVPGLAVAVVKDGEVALAEGFGVRRHGGTETVDADTLFSIGSTTKAFTAAALALLVEEGKIGWDEPVITYLPGFRVEDPYVTRELTVRDLLTHRSGVESTDLLWVAGYDRDQITQRLAHAEQASSLRSQWAYNNSLYIVAGEVLEAVAGTSWEDFVQRRILKPLGMETTMMVSDGIEARPNFAHAHDTDEEGAVKILPYPHIHAAGPAGSMQSSVAEMARWIALLLNEGEVGEKRLLKAETVTEFFRPQMLLDGPTYPAARQADPHFFAYGQAWFLQDYRGRKVVMHTGSIWGMSAIVGLVPEEELGMVALLNHDHAELRHALMYTVFDRYLGPRPEGVKDWSADLLALYHSPEEASGRSQAPDADTEPPRLPLENYTGTYADDLYGNLMVQLQGDPAGLILKWGENGLIADLLHQGHDTFGAVYRDQRMGTMVIQFHFGPRGGVRELEIVGFREFRRVE